MRATFPLAPPVYALAGALALGGCGARTPLLLDGPDVTGGADGSVGLLDSGVKGADSGVRPRDAGVGAGDSSTRGPDGGHVCGDHARVFVTSLMYDGDLGGLQGADGNCAARAAAAGLGGEFRAWLSDGTTDAYAHIGAFPGGYALLDGTVIAPTPTALFGGLLHAIDMNEHAAVVTDGNREVWTGTGPDGLGGGAYCTDGAGEDWSSGDMNSSTPLVGFLDATDPTWTDAYAQFCNRTNVRLYCFELCPYRL